MRWQFANAMFDAAAWVLQVDGVRVHVEKKPLQLLRLLLEHDGDVVSKDAMLDAVWPGVIVVEASLPTAIAKLRRALGDVDGAIIETVPGIGYRIAVPVSVSAVTTMAPGGQQQEPAPATPRRWRRWALATAVAAAGGIGLMALRPADVTRNEVLVALATLEPGTVRALLDRGWDPNMALDVERNHALNRVLATCEYDRGHDRQKLAAVVKLLLDAQTNIFARNVWGDTPYSIASAKRYCGPDHPATRLLAAACTNHEGALIPDCRADYAHARWPQLPQRGTRASAD
jgi:DNA-binding winged helix-turn-helix (wHTH) protein